MFSCVVLYFQHAPAQSQNFIWFLLLSGVHKIIMLKVARYFSNQTKNKVFCFGFFFVILVVYNHVVFLDGSTKFSPCNLTTFVEKIFCQDSPESQWSNFNFFLYFFPFACKLCRHSINYNVFHNLRMRVARCSASCVNGRLKFTGIGAGKVNAASPSCPGVLHISVVFDPGVSRDCLWIPVQPELSPSESATQNCCTCI